MSLQPSDDDDEITAIRDRLAALDAERATLESRLASLLTLQKERQAAASPPPSSAGSMTGAAAPAAKIALFRSLFRGREDVFPKRWSNPKSGKSGYSPACANEWVAKALVSYQTLPTTLWVDPSSTGEPRLRGALRYPG